MSHKARFWVILLFAVLQSSLLRAAPPLENALPPFSSVRDTVNEYFGKIRNYEDGDLLNQEMVAPLLAKLQKQWLPTADAKAVFQCLPAKDSFIVQQLSTPNGIKFMRNISGYPDAYDRVDRLSRMPHGKQTIIDLIRGPGGEKMIEYMTTTPGGQALGEQLSNAPTGQNFNEPTETIYTADQLLGDLEMIHKKLVKAAEKKGAQKAQRSR